MKILIDVGVGAGVESFLRDAGHDVVSVRDLNPSMEDAEILDRAVRENRLVITMDKDFGELVYRQDRAHAGVLLLRLEDANGRTKVTVVAKIFEEHSETLHGRISVYGRGYLRIRDADIG